jgi:hypothetical protein
MQSGGRKQGSGWRMSGVATIFPSLLKRLGPFCVACLRLPKGRSCACCFSAPVRAYGPTIKPVLTPLTVHHLLFLFRIQFRHSSGAQRDLSRKEMTRSLCVCQWCWNMSVERVNTTSISIYVWQAQLDSEFQMGREGCALIAGTQGSLPWSGSRKEILHTMSQSAGETRTPRSWIDS